MTILANAKLVLADEIVTGAVTLKGGVIDSVDQGAGAPAGAVDCEGDWLAPGLVELHTDNLERHMQPRPGVHWPRPAAVLAHDAELASVGVTTVFDALRVGSVTSRKSRYGRYARELADIILAHRDAGNLKIRHFLHLRAEICSETLLEELAEFGPADRVGIVSLMDHTPGQRQFRDLSKLVEYLKGKYGMAEPDIAEHLALQKALSARVRPAHEPGAVEEGRRLGATLASHDDTTESDVAASVARGCRIAEFPTTKAAAVANHRAGIAVVMGAPNLLRGGSHSGNVSAAELAEAGVLDILSSDYAPSSLLMGAVKLGLEGGDMAAAIRMVTARPAAAAGLTDRGEIAAGKAADLVRFRVSGGFPVIRAVWARGQVV